MINKKFWWMSSTNTTKCFRVAKIRKLFTKVMNLSIKKLRNLMSRKTARRKIISKLLDSLDKLITLWSTRRFQNTSSKLIKSYQSAKISLRIPTSPAKRNFVANKKNWKSLTAKCTWNDGTTSVKEEPKPWKIILKW